VEGVTRGAVEALATNELLHIRVSSDAFNTTDCTLTGKAYEAVDSNFAAPDTSFVRHLTQLADITAFDAELKRRCLPILGAGAADPKLWDSAVRTAGVILEERLRDVGRIKDRQAVGRDLVNKVFGKTGTLAAKFAHEAEREGYRDLYAGVVGAFRNPSAHRLIDPEPQEGGAYIAFVNLLLKMLDDLRSTVHLNRETFLTSCPPEARAFFTKVLTEAEKRGLQVRWASESFLVHKKGQLLDFFRCKIGGYLELFDRDVAEEVRSQFLSLPAATKTARFVVKIPVTRETLSDAESAWELALRTVLA
jgi:hypothetical protein